VTKSIRGAKTHEGVALFKKAQKNSSRARNPSYTQKDLGHVELAGQERLIRADVSEAHQQVVRDLKLHNEALNSAALRGFIWSSDEVAVLPETGKEQQRLNITSTTDFPELNKFSSSRSPLQSPPPSPSFSPSASPSSLFWTGLILSPSTRASSEASTSSGASSDIEDGYDVVGIQKTPPSSPADSGDESEGKGNGSSCYMM